nr:MAG TPA: hypothetical protein [Caudoviricetes sp.]
MLILRLFLRIYVNLHSAFQLLLNNRVSNENENQSLGSGFFVISSI